ncbi:hypothetical protein [Carboxylicivirga sp. RSCT41]|uniref:hypothetical protein n=1 Tax=Carboxylicivirga agarovorans TaxID=3417570 RepID=UPI003D34B3F4
MNSSLTYLVSCLLFLAACSENDNSIQSNTFIEIPDSEFESILIEQGIDSDGMINQKILRTDAEQVVRLDLNKDASYGVITDLSGIESFINITYLSAARHEIDSIDLSFNTRLDTLYLYANYLNHIDLSKNTELLEIDIQSNQLSTITGLANAGKLKKLNVSFNDIEHLIISNTAIEVLHASNNLLTTCDLSEAIKLKNILLTSNQLGSINLNSNNLLETLLISDNRLNDINLAYNGQLSHLYISSNQLNNLDLSPNTKLIDLRADRNPDLKCIQILPGQNIPTAILSDYQVLNSSCN